MSCQRSHWSTWITNESLGKWLDEPLSWDSSGRGWVARRTYSPMATSLSPPLPLVFVHSNSTICYSSPDRGMNTWRMSEMTTNLNIWLSFTWFVNGKSVNAIGEPINACREIHPRLQDISVGLVLFHHHMYHHHDLDPFGSYINGWIAWAKVLVANSGKTDTWR